MSDETTMKKCNHVECGGKLQPHSIDSATGELDCDGPCSPRRVEAWKASLKQPYDGSIEAPTESVMAGGRKAMLYPLVKPHYADHPQCYDCGKPAKVTVIETSSDSRAWLWCNMCEVG